MVVSSDSRIRIQLLTAGEEVYLTLDGQRGVPLAKNDIIEAGCPGLKLKLISSPRRNYFDLIRDKLGWGVLK
jgi:NAD+ kinase